MPGPACRASAQMVAQAPQRPPAAAPAPAPPAHATRAEAVADSYFQLGGSFFAFCARARARRVTPLCESCRCCPAQSLEHELVQKLYPHDTRTCWVIN